MGNSLVHGEKRPKMLVLDMGHSTYLPLGPTEYLKSMVRYSQWLKLVK